jgi:hypothetical protein
MTTYLWYGTGSQLLLISNFLMESYMCAKVGFKTSKQGITCSNEGETWPDVALADKHDNAPVR